MNYYELFGIKMQPVVDNTRLVKKYIDLQKQFHPDYYVNENEADKAEAMEKSSQVNDAYNTFNNRSKTLAYYLRSKGALDNEEKHQLPMDFLGEMMEINEEITEDNIAIAKSTIENINKELDDDIDPLLKMSEERELNDAEIDLLKEYYFKKKYLNRIFDRLAD